MNSIPSATNPIYVRIGDTVHSITSALSVTRNAGTNWFNAGSATLATKEIDYFVYLGYNATDGVVVGFARIPYATQYDQFSTTTTEEKYCAISTISNAAAGDDYTVVGRFAATLSAGAGYTWTVPTFTTVNLIQRPIFDTRYLDFNVIVAGVAPLTFTIASTDVARYCIKRQTLYLYERAVGTTGGSAGSSLNLTLPMSMSSAYLSLGVARVGEAALMGYVNDSGDVASVNISYWDNHNITTGASRYIISNFVYQIA